MFRRLLRSTFDLDASKETISGGLEHNDGKRHALHTRNKNSTVTVDSTFFKLSIMMLASKEKKERIYGVMQCNN